MNEEQTALTIQIEPDVAEFVQTLLRNEALRLREGADNNAGGCLHYWRLAERMSNDFSEAVKFARSKGVREE